MLEKVRSHQKSSNLSTYQPQANQAYSIDSVDSVDALPRLPGQSLTSPTPVTSMLLNVKTSTRNHLSHCYLLYDVSALIDLTP